MPKPTLSAADFVRLYETEGAREVSRRTGVSERKVRARRARIEKVIGRPLVGPNNHKAISVAHPHRACLDIENGTVLVGSDAHIWPGAPSTAMRAFVKFCKDLKPEAVILNGDVIDAATISKHPPIGWENRPSVQQEIEAAQDQLHTIETAAGKARKIWTLGNHDGRFETRLATVAPEFAKVHGVHLRDHFALWEAAWSCWIGETVVIKHRFKGGIHAPHNNTMWAGRTMITGHLHSAKVTPLTDYNGTRYGVDTGCLADPDHKAFVDYTEDGPKNWRSAFCVLTFHKGRLMQPELVLVWDEQSVEFRGTIWKV